MSAFAERYSQYQEAVEKALPLFFPVMAENQGGQAAEAARYSLLGGGKRIRPVLLLAVTDMLDASFDRAMPFACAVEMIHTYSLIHDDLPCMDDDDLRRGRPTCHKVFGEAMAVLAGDALLNRAFEVMLEHVDLQNPGTVAAARIVAQAAGVLGMIGGQALDLTSEGKIISLTELQLLHRLKTGALLKAPTLAGAALAGTTQEITELLAQFADAIGLAFQIQDDILDATADTQILGKSAGKDLRDQKSTYATLRGLDAARGFLDDAMQDARAALNSLAEHGLKIDFLMDLTGYLLTRAK
ncbi:MAG TPA: farnesyl-diphosphate synthase [Clostridiales bacterium]|nr:farnesyl-diphosphate synthase [Clostridiales bacterium]